MKNKGSMDSLNLLIKFCTKVCKRVERDLSEKPDNKYLQQYLAMYRKNLSEVKAEKRKHIKDSRIKEDDKQI